MQLPTDEDKLINSIITLESEKYIKSSQNIR